MNSLLGLCIAERSFSILHAQSKRKTFFLIFQALTSVNIEKVDLPDDPRAGYGRAGIMQFGKHTGGFNADRNHHRNVP